MSDRNKEQEDQAAALRKLFNEVQGKGEEAEEIVDKQKEDSDDDLFSAVEPTREIDILDLPPRKEVHSLNKNRTKLKVSRPLLRFSFVILMLILIIIAVYYVWGDDLIPFQLTF